MTTLELHPSLQRTFGFSTTSTYDSYLRLIWYLFFCITYNFFEVGSQTFRKKLLQNFEVAASKFNIDHPLTSMVSKTALPNISKIASKKCIFSKDWWEVWIVGGDRTKTKWPQQWGVFCKSPWKSLRELTLYALQIPPILTLQ